MPDFGIGEAAAGAGLFEGLFGGAEAATAATAAAGSTLLPEIPVIAGAAGAGAGEAALAGAGAGAAGLAGAAAGGAFDSGSSPILDASGVPTGLFEPSSGTPGVQTPQGAPPLTTLAGGLTPQGGPGPTAFTPIQGVQAPSPDLTSTGTPNLDVAAGQDRSGFPEVTNPNAPVNFPGGPEVKVPGVPQGGAANASLAGPTTDQGFVGPTLDQLSTPAQPIAGAPTTGSGGVVPGATPPATATPGGTSPNFLDKLVTGAENQVTKNPLGLALGGAGLGYALLAGDKKPANYDTLQGQANTLAGQAQQLQSYLASGTLPPGVQAAVTQASKGAKAKAISNAAASGMPTDPQHNSQLASELAQIDTNAAIAQGQIATQLLQTGITEAGLSSQIYQTLLGIDQQQSANTGKAIANFAAAMGGGTKIQIGGTSA